MIDTLYDYPGKVKKIVAGFIAISNEGYIQSESLYKLLKQLNEESAEVEGFEVTKLEDYLAFDDVMQEMILTLLYELSHRTEFSCTHGVCYALLEKICQIEQQASFKKIVKVCEFNDSVGHNVSDLEIKNKNKENQTDNMY